MKIDDDLIARNPIPKEAEDLIRSNWADRTAYGIAGQNPTWHNYVDDLAQEARLVMWRDAEKFDSNHGGDIVAYCKQRGRWAILGIVTGSHLFTGQERAEPVAQARGDASRSRLQAAERALTQSLGREPTAAELAAELGISERTVYKQRASIKNLPGADIKPHVGSLEELLEAAGNEAVLGEATDPAVAALAYHYKEIHEALAALSESGRRYVWLRFWEGWSEPEIRREGIEVSWTHIQPILAESLGHLLGGV